MKFSSRWVAALSLFAAWPVLPAPATCSASVSASSGAATIPVIELYTSEGCDSCPPADRWFLRLDTARVVPLAFHVDYWDSIGWKDRFAQPRFAERQREAVRRQNGRVAYTPQVILDGRDIRPGGFLSEFDSQLAAIARRPARAGLRLDARWDRTVLLAEVGVSIPLAEDRADAVLYLALTENRLTSRVTAGENRGALLAHAHVVREWVGPIVLAPLLDRTGTTAIALQIALGPGWKREHLALVPFVQNLRSGQTLQALRSDLCCSAAPC